MDERGLTETEAQSGTAGAQFSNAEDGETPSLGGGVGGDPPEEDQAEGAQGSDSSGDNRDEEEEGAAPSLYLEIISEPASHREDIPAAGRVGDGLADRVSRSETSPVPEASELDTSADSGLTRESEDEGGREDSEVTDRSASADTPAGVGQLSGPTCPADRSDEESVTVPLSDCNTEAVRCLGLDLSPLDASDVNNTTNCLSLDFSDGEIFFDLVWEVQSRRLNDQRCSFRKKIKDRRAYRSMPSSPLDEKRPFFPSTCSLQTEEFFDLIACSQGRRLDDQRADFEDSPIVELGSPFPEETLEYLAPVGRAASHTPREEPPTGAEDPAAERGHSPTEGEEPPAEKEEVPAGRDEVPAERDEIPAEVGEDPAEKGLDAAEREEIPAEKGQDPAEREEIPAEKGQDPAEREEIPAEEAKIPAEKKGPDDELYNTILTHQSASARIEDQRSHPPAYSSKEFFDLLERLQERRMDEQRAAPPPGLAPTRAAERGREERRGSIFSPLLKGMSQRRANSS